MAFLHFVVVVAVLTTAVALPPVQETTTSRVQAFDNMLNPAKTACAQYKLQESCHKECFYKHLGLLDKDGRYVESKTAEFMSTFIIPEGILTQEQVNKLAKACNSLNDNIKPGCDRGDQLWNCIHEESFKITGKRH